MLKVATYLLFLFLISTPLAAIAQPDCEGTLGCPCALDRRFPCFRRLGCNGEICVPSYPTECAYAIGTRNCPCHPGMQPCRDSLVCDADYNVCRPNDEHCRDCLSPSP